MASMQPVRKMTATRQQNNRQTDCFRFLRTVLFIVKPFRQSPASVSRSRFGFNSRDFRADVYYSASMRSMGASAAAMISGSSTISSHFP